MPLTSLGLALNFAGGSSESFGSSYFTLAPDGLSFDGATLSISTAVTSAVLTGDFGVTAWTLNDNSTFTASPSFTATITDPSGTLPSGDFAVIYRSSQTSVTPEPATWLLLAAGFAALLLFRYRAPSARSFTPKRLRYCAVSLFCALLLTASASRALASSFVKLDTWVTPTAATSGTSPIWITGSGFPSGTIDPSSVKLTLQTSCGVTVGETPATASAVRAILGTAEKIEFQIPAAVATGNYFASLSGATTGGTDFSSSNCSQVSVTHAPPALPVGIPGSWHLVFNDEFNGTKLDTTKWTPTWVGCTTNGISTPVNVAEFDAYDPAQVSVANGVLSLALIENPVTVCGTDYKYRAGMVQSDGKAQFTFGAFEARVNLPAVAGVIANWPAVWTDGQNWPTDGEMDIMEGLTGSACFHFHDPSGGPGNCVSGDFTGWHTFGSDWEPGIVNYYYDGKLVGTIHSGITSSPLYLILNYATGTYGGPVVAPATMQVDYMRVWQH